MTIFACRKCEPDGRAFICILLDPFGATENFRKCTCSYKEKCWRKDAKVRH